MAASKALKNEAVKPDTIDFEFDGVTYTIKADAMDDIDVMEATENQKYVTAAKTILGPAQWLKFRSKPRNYTVDLNNLLDAVFTAIAGATPGE